MAAEWGAEVVGACAGTLACRARDAGRRHKVLGPFHEPDFQASPEVTALRVTGGDLVAAKD